MHPSPNLMSAEGQQAALFARLDRLFADSPDHVLTDDEESICCTRVGAWLMDFEGFTRREAMELAFEWAKQPKYLGYNATCNY